MKTVFADTLYWVATARPLDSWRPAAYRARRDLGRALLITTDEVLTHDHHFQQEGYMVLMRK